MLLQSKFLMIKSDDTKERKSILIYIMDLVIEIDHKGVRTRS